MKFDCKYCNSMCCVTPPAMTSIDEAKNAIGLGALVIAYPVTEDSFAVMVAKDPKTMMCPFVDNGGCSIYDDRFDACREFTCTAKEYEISDLSHLSAKEILSYQTTQKDWNKAKQGTLINTSEANIKKAGVVVLKNEYIVTQITVAFDMEDAMEMASSQKEKLKTLNSSLR